MPRDPLGTDPLDDVDDAVLDLRPQRRRQRRRTVAEPDGEGEPTPRTSRAQSSPGADKDPTSEGQGPRDAAQAAPARAKLTAEIPTPILERARDAVYWTPGLTLVDLVTTSLERELARREDDRGSAFEPRAGDLPTGRPVT